jgi:intracellular sulfur oxidation DsrE/DsrF family protein
MKDSIILCTAYGMGRSEEAGLSLKLIAKYLELLIANGNLPAAICFYTDGVRLVVSGSPVIEPLKRLEARGVRLVVCSTCLEEMHLAEEVKVGIVGGMADILEAQTKAAKVITI